MLKQLGKGKAILLLGARQTGKTTLIRNLIKEENLDVVYLTGDDDFDVELFATPRRDMWNQILGSKKAVFIDEAQRITHIGRSIKLLLDQRTDVQVFLSGSSSFQLANLLDSLAEDGVVGNSNIYTNCSRSVGTSRFRRLAVNLDTETPADNQH